MAEPFSWSSGPFLTLNVVCWCFIKRRGREEEEEEENGGGGRGRGGVRGGCPACCFR